MGASGEEATLVIVLSNRASTARCTELSMPNTNMMASRKVDYAQQQDMNIPKTTVRDAVIFGARLRQPRNIRDAGKLPNVDGVIATLGLTGFANGVIRGPG